MASYKLTNKAVQDLSEIWDYTFQEWSEDQADHYYGMLLSNCQKLANNPEIGKKYPNIIEGLFGFRVGKHVIFYRIILEKKIEITRILHERMNLKKRIIE